MPVRRLPRPTRPPPPAQHPRPPEAVARRALGQVLRVFREAHPDRPSQERLGEWAAIHRNYISSGERGERNVAFVALGRWLGALGVSWQDFGAAVDGTLAALPERRVEPQPSTNRANPSADV